MPIIGSFLTTYPISYDHEQSLSGFTACLVLLATAGINGSSPTSEEQPVSLYSFQDDGVCVSSSEHADQLRLLTSRKDAQNSSEALVLLSAQSEMAREWCVLPVDSTNKQRKRFQKCLKRLGECDMDADTNSDGDLLITCED